MRYDLNRASSKGEVSCANPVCPLNHIKAGIAVRVRRLCAAPEIADRLREIGFCEDQVIKLVNTSANIICLVCNTRLALSEKLAESILVEPVLDRIVA